MELEGRHHSGIDDCLNITKIIFELLKRGHQFVSPIVIADDYDPSTDTTFKDYNKERSLFLPLSEDEVQSRNMGTNVVVLRGLPYSATEDDVRFFFSALDGSISAVHMISNADGRPSGIAYVIFGDDQSARLALENNLKDMGGRYIEVFLSDLDNLNFVLSNQERRESTADGTQKQLEKNTKFKSGDWMCPNCADHQFAHRIQCRRCAAPKPFTFPPSFPPLMRQGDWICPHCSDLQFASRSICRHCGMARASLPSPPLHTFLPPIPFLSPTLLPSINMRPGDWICPNCGDIQFASRSCCRKCSTPRPSSSPLPPHSSSSPSSPSSPSPLPNKNTTVKRPGDWICPNCGDHQFASRTVCRQCATARPPSSSIPSALSTHSSRGAPSAPPVTTTMREGDWVCPNCGDLQFASRSLCRMCACPKSC